MKRKGVLVKLCKPQQDIRADLPAIGISTVINAEKAGLAGIAVQAGRALVIEREKMLAAANEAALRVWYRSRPEGQRFMSRPLKIAVIAGEVSEICSAATSSRGLKQIYPGEISLVGVGGESLIGQGLTSLFDFSELSVMGLTQVLKGLPKFIRLIGLTSRTIIAEKPDLLLIIDSPDFTHRVARKVRAALPDLPIVNYVCPSVWAWKEYRREGHALLCGSRAGGIAVRA